MAAGIALVRRERCLNVNIASTCNAFWNGSSVNFFQAGSGCNNSGEIRDVVQHEWGHGLDGNDGVPPVDAATGEAIGDYIAFFVDNDSCVGQSFTPGPGTGPYCTTIPDLHDHSALRWCT